MSTAVDTSRRNGPFAFNLRNCRNRGTTPGPHLALTDRRAWDTMMEGVSGGRRQTKEYRERKADSRG